MTEFLGEPKYGKLFLLSIYYFRRYDLYLFFLLFLATAPLSGRPHVQNAVYTKPPWVQPTDSPTQAATGTLTHGPPLHHGNAAQSNNIQQAAHVDFDLNVNAQKKKHLYLSGLGSTNKFNN